MNVFVFVGPSLAAAEAAQYIEATFLPPIEQGDLRRLAGRASAVGIIDGAFDQRPAVWHKEILWLLSQQIPVFGAASMGALRACELAPFGMVGVGEIFKAFHSRELEDDDELAVVHLTAERGFAPVSEALVNIRATLRAARAAGVVDGGFADRFLSCAKRLHYADRSFERVSAECRRSHDDADNVANLLAWLPLGRVDLKRRDAVSMLIAMRSMLGNGWRPDPPAFVLEDTNAWRVPTRESRRSPRWGQPERR